MSDEEMVVGECPDEATIDRLRAEWIALEKPSDLSKDSIPESVDDNLQRYLRAGKYSPLRYQFCVCGYCEHKWDQDKQEDISAIRCSKCGSSHIRTIIAWDGGD